VAHLLQSPVSIATLFLARFYECVTFSSWALAFLASPVLIAYGLERSAPWPFFLALLLFYLPFVVLPAALGATCTILLVRFLAGVRRNVLVVVGVGCTILLFFLFRSRLEPPDLSDLATIQAILDRLGQTQSAFLPSSWVARGVLASVTGDLPGALFELLLLSSHALLATWVAVLVAERCFETGWARLADFDDAGPAPSARRRRLVLLERLMRPLGEPERSLVIKDLRLFWRDPAQWSQFALFFGMLGLYFANLGRQGGAWQQEPWRGWIALLNIGASLLILATLTTRFVYPLISLEGRRFWILGLAPLSRRRLLLQKVGLSIVATSLFTMPLALLSGLRIGHDAETLGLSLLSVAATTVGLSGLAVGLGSLYPRFDEDNPTRITSGLGGTLNFILSLIYVALITAALALIVQWRLVAPWLPSDARPLVVLAVVTWVLLLTLLAGCVPLWLGLRNLERAEL
jgi:ABC-2 type transport system permease protein